MGQDYASRIYNWDFRALVVSFGHKRRKGVWTSGGPFMCIREKLDHGGGKDFDLLFNSVPWKGKAIGVKSGVKPPPQVKSGTRAGSGGGHNGALRNDAVVEGYASFNDHVVANQGRFATGWARARPGNPEAGLFQTAVELRDLPSIPLTSFLKVNPFNLWGKVALDRTRAFSKLGSEYLNVEFGWRPFVRDLQALYRTMKTIDKQMAQLKRDNNRLIRRRRTVEDTTETSSVSTPATVANVGVEGAPPNWFRPPASSMHTITTTTTVKSWFAAGYMYHIADTLSWKWDARARAVLFGALPTPQAVWSVLPWSWLDDWFFNMGDVLSNISPNAVDNLVAKYAFIMTHTRTLTTHHVSTTYSGRTSTPTVKVSGGGYTTFTKHLQEVKFRCAGSPYGLGAKYGDLSDHQKGILAALGISRSRF